MPTDFQITCHMDMLTKGKPVKKRGDRILSEKEKKKANTWVEPKRLHGRELGFEVVFLLKKSRERCWLRHKRITRSWSQPRNERLGGPNKKKTWPLETVSRKFLHWRGTSQLLSGMHDIPGRYLSSEGKEGNEPRRPESNDLKGPDLGTTIRLERGRPSVKEAGKRVGRGFP